MEKLTEKLKDALDDCESMGMILPFIVCALSANGSVLCIRAKGGEPDILAEHYEPEGFRAPLTVVVLDQRAKAVRIEISIDGKRTFH